MSTGHHIAITRPAHASERQQLAHVLSAAFLEIPPTRWLIPDRDARRARFPNYALIWIDHGLATGAVEVAQTTEGALAGLAIWWPEPTSEPANYNRRLAEAVGHEHLPRLRGVRQRDTHRAPTKAASLPRLLRSRPRLPEPRPRHRVAPPPSHRPRHLQNPRVPRRRIRRRATPLPQARIPRPPADHPAGRATPLPDVAAPRHGDHRMKATTPWFPTTHAKSRGGGSYARTTPTGSWW